MKKNRSCFWFFTFCLVRLQSSIQEVNNNTHTDGSQTRCVIFLAVGLGDTLDLILLLDGRGVGGTLGGVEDLISEALSDGLSVLEGSSAGTLGDQVNGRVDATKGGNIDGLTTDSTLGTDTGGILTGTSVHDGVAEDLDGVGTREQMDDLQGVTHDAHRHQLLTVVATVHHQGVGHTLNNGALSLAERLLLVTSSSVGQVLLVLDLLVH